MYWVALRMLVGDRNKYYGLIFGVAFSCLLMSHQVSIFVGVMLRTTSQIWDVHPSGIWVMDPHTLYIDEIRPLPREALERVRGVEGVDWAVPLAKNVVRVQTSSGQFRQVVLLGLDDVTLLGAPERMILGSLEDLKNANSVIVDTAGYKYLWPDRAPELGLPLEINDSRATLVGICAASPPFQTMPIVYTRLSTATNYVPDDRSPWSFILVQPKDSRQIMATCTRISTETNLLALTTDQFFWNTIAYYFKFTGIPLNFGITVSLGFVVGMAISGQTFYLFVSDNMRQFALLKAFGLDDQQLVKIVLFQMFVVGTTGYGIGVFGALALMESLSRTIHHLAGFRLSLPVMGGVALAVATIMILVSFFSIRQVLNSEPAVLFKA